MNFRVGTALLAVPLLLSLTSTSEAGIAGRYTVIFFVGAGHVQAATRCFKLTRTNTILDYTYSGTWAALDYPGWGGNWVVDHGTLRLYGTANSATEATDQYGLVSGKTITGQGFDDWIVSDTPISIYNDGVFKMTKGCSTAAQAAAARPRHGLATKD